MVWTLQSSKFLNYFFDFLKLAPVWEQLAEDLSAVNNLVIAKMDSTVNEVEGLRV